jgi:hypothetical protein
MSEGNGEATLPAVDRTAKQRLLLYIDILNFSSIARQPSRVEELYKIINQLNVHRHGVFNIIIFSDTILVYNKDGPFNLEDVKYLVMFLCEFAQDLHYRLIGRDIFFRGYITCGGFAHYAMENIKDVYYGEALIEAYNAEKDIQCIGLFMANIVVPYSDIFKTRKYNDRCHFVYIMQSLGRHNWKRHEYPIDPFLMDEADEIWWVAHDVHYLATIHKHKEDTSLSGRVRKKYQATWKMLLIHHPGVVPLLEENGFDPTVISKCDWSEAIARIADHTNYTA